MRRRIVGCILALALAGCSKSPQTSLTEPIRGERNRLLTEIDTNLRRDLLVLAEKFPQLATTNSRTLREQLKEAPKSGISIWAARYEGAKGGSRTPLAPKDRYGISIVVRQRHFWKPNEARAQVSFDQPLSEFPHLALEGEVRVEAGDPALDAALKKLVEDALAPLRNLEKQAAAE